VTSNVPKRLEIDIKKTYYTYERYNSISTFVMLYHQKELTISQFGSLLRISDKFIKIDDNHFFIIFEFTSQENTFKACQNLLEDLDNFFKDRTTCIAIDTFSTDKTAQVVYSRLMQILKETQKKSYTRIEDENILNTHY
jgi:hypothetical protein